MAEHLVYKGMMLEGVPNLAFAVGYTNASWTLKADLTCDYVCRLLNLMRATAPASARRSTTTRRSTPAPLLGLNVGLRPALGRPVPEAGRPVPVAGAPELPARLPRPADARLDDEAMVFSNPAPTPAASEPCEFPKRR